ncbi:MAG: glutamine synthetase type III, partial [Coriobacteriales bacterium]|nr:glutamine synthetase type III [Coriobacteriales bacterium]
LACLVAAVDEHADLMRMSVASAGNDHRLGANEAPPAIVSVFLGDALTPVVKALIKKEHHTVSEDEVIDLGVPALPDIFRDNTDRNRTSPFAFTGNKFEFRMCGSQQNIADPTMVINVAVAEQCERFCDYVAAAGDEDFYAVAMRFVRHTFRDHERIIFDGNGYSDEWQEEAARRGLPNLKTTPDALPALIKPENIALFEHYGVLCESEARARYVAKAEQYAKLLNIEANVMVRMARNLYIPALITYSGDVATTVATKAELGIVANAEKVLANSLTKGIDAIYELASVLEDKNADARAIADPAEKDQRYCDDVIPAMEALRAAVDSMEVICSADVWPVPTYNDMLFYV